MFDFSVLDVTKEAVGGIHIMLLVLHVVLLWSYIISIVLWSYIVLWSHIMLLVLHNLLRLIL